MQKTGVTSSVLFLLVISVALFGFAMLPHVAAADTISAQTAQVLPPGGNSCTALVPSNFQAFTQNGSLDSFEFTVPDASYVALAASVGNTSVPFNFMTRRVDPNGTLHIHVDIYSTRIVGTLPILVTMVSSPAGAPTCVSVVAASVGSGAVQTSPSPAPTPSTPVAVPTPAPTPSATSGQGSAAPTPSPAASGTAANAAGLSTIASSIVGVCQEASSAYRLWLGLLVVFAILVGLALWAEFPASVPWMRTPESVAVAILVVLLVLLGFWYFAVPCRSEFWMPLVAVLIAILGILAAFRNHPRLTQMLLLQE